MDEGYFGHYADPDRRQRSEAAEPPDNDDDEISSFINDPVLRHRAAALVREGMNPRQARVLALDRDVDKSWVIDRLLRRGCPPDVAFDIASAA